MPKVESKIEFINLAMPSLTNTDQQTTSTNTNETMLIVPNRKEPVERIAFTYQIRSAHIRTVIDHMLNTYGEEGSCLVFTSNAMQIFGDKKMDDAVNFSNFDYDTVLQKLQHTGSNVPSTPVSTVFMIKLDILSVDEDELKAFNGTMGEHIHSLLIIVDSDTAEYQILMAFNDSFTLNEFYSGILLNECQGKDIKTGSVGANDIKTFKDYHNNNIIPYAGTISNVSNSNVGSLITELKQLASTKTNKVMLDGDVLKKLNILCGFDNFNKDYKAEVPETHGCFGRNVKGMGTAYSGLRYDVATVNREFLAN